ncbi:MAG: peptidoglycan DD-metalloendopeptidase family protein [Armatimonadetes bacterium]|nr:peptidoglycan DD-metalloendopeptidase family protein [Armatimonadota bacterium]NIO75510.1 peptidoglycan DD-metalloendopeptidase family protein [Armatimonadota bacterium]NIO95887.1 peptidoglycan DD-metalloendopeptidase family protein [Armatimonadota bacterium]
MAQDAVLLAEYEEACRQRAIAANRAAEHLEYIESLKENAAENHARAVKERKDTAYLKQRIYQQRVVWERALAELEQNSREVEALLQRLQTTKTGRERLSQPFTGKFKQPVEGRISSGFGYRTHPIFKVRKMHTGVDIAAPHRTRIRAAAAGLVIHAKRWGGYGKCILIDHGGGLATLYAHCSSLAVSVGERVKQGQVIGRVGSTGISTGPHLHFEVRRNGKPVDPQIR